MDNDRKTYFRLFEVDDNWNISSKRAFCKDFMINAGKLAWKDKDFRLGGQ